MNILHLVICERKLTLLKSYNSAVLLLFTIADYFNSDKIDEYILL